MNISLDDIDTSALGTLGPEYREWMNPAIWCGWCGHIHVICQCERGGGGR